MARSVEIPDFDSGPSFSFSDAGSELSLTWNRDYFSSALVREDFLRIVIPGDFPREISHSYEKNCE